jgi:hypothetical protein
MLHGHIKIAQRCNTNSWAQGRGMKTAQNSQSSKVYNAVLLTYSRMVGGGGPCVALKHAIWWRLLSTIVQKGQSNAGDYDGLCVWLEWWRQKLCAETSWKTSIWKTKKEPEGYKMKINLREIDCGDRRWLGPADDRVQWRVTTLAAVKFMGYAITMLAIDTE